jgi:metallo-beta-lactamase class B
MQQRHCLSLSLLAAAGLFTVPGIAAVDMAEVLAATNQGIAAAMCPSHAVPPTSSPGGSAAAMDDFQAHGVAPFRVFDNLYYIGMANISAWAITTSEGIILIESMMVRNWQQTIEDGLVTLGLDPADIRYVVISHAHNDHWGGASFLQEKYGARIVMSERDWMHMLEWPQIGTPAPFPAKDIGVSDGDTLTLGDTTLRFIATPGHTPGTISTLIPVRDGNSTHLVAYWGGPSMSYLDPDDLELYIGSSYKLETADTRVDVGLTNHPFGDGTFIKQAALNERQPGDPHPFVIGHQGVQNWLEQLRVCTREVLSQKRAAAD